MPTYADGAVVIQIDADGKLAIKELKDTDKEIDNIGKSAEEAQKGASAMAKGYAAVATAMTAAGVAAVKVSGQFDAAFAKTQTIMDETEVAVEDMREEVLALSDDSGMAATNVSEAVYQAISGSVATADAVAFVDDANKLAVSGFTSLTNATDVLTTTLNAYGLSADKVGGISNVLIQTQNLGKTSVDELASSMGRAISTGSAYGVNLQNLSTAYVELTRGGIATAEATTYLSGMLNELGDSGSVVGEILQEQTGKTFGQLMQDGWSLGDVMKVLGDCVHGDAEELMGLWSSQEAGKASNAIMTQGIEDFNDVLLQMNNEMAGATGTTDKAYETMTNTSEFIDQRFQNSVKNLGIAFGDDLRPVLDGVKSVFTDVLGGFTDFINESPWVSAAFAAVTVGVGAMAVVLTGYTVQARLAESATLKLTMAMATNPVVLVVGAIAALGVGIATLVENTNDATAELEEMTAAARNFDEVVKSSEETYKQTRGELDGTAAVAREYVAELARLEGQGQLTEIQQAEYNSTVEKLRTLLPDLNLELDEQTGLLKGGAAVLDEQIDNWYELAIAQALQDKYTEQIQAQAEAEAELYTRQLERNDLEERRKEIQEQINALQRDSASIAEQMGAAQDRLRNGESDGGLYDQLTERQSAITNSMQILESQLEGVNGDIAEVDEAIDIATTTIDENKAAVDASKGAYMAYAGELEGATSSAGALAEQTRITSEDIQSASETLKAAYDEAYTSAYNSIDSQIGLFDNMSETVKKTSEITQESAQEAGQGFIESLDSELAYMDTYAANMQRASELGIDQGLLQILSDGSTEHAEILANMVNMSEEQIKEMNDKYAKVSEGKQDFADAMVEYTGVVQEEKDDMVELAKRLGIDVSDSMTSELLNGLPDFEAAWARYQQIMNARDAAANAAANTQRAANSSYKNSHYSAYASGTDYATSGLALVGEAGPELVFFHGGERVLTAEETQNALQSVLPVAPQMAYIGAGTPASAGRSTVQLHATIAVPLEIDGREFARASAEYIGIEQEFGVM